jgi:hypothetical protein
MAIGAPARETVFAAPVSSVCPWVNTTKPRSEGTTHHVPNGVLFPVLNKLMRQRIGA